MNPLHCNMLFQRLWGSSGAGGGSLVKLAYNKQPATTAIIATTATSFPQVEIRQLRVAFRCSLQILISLSSMAADDLEELTAARKFVREVLLSVQASSIRDSRSASFSMHRKKCSFSFKSVPAFQNRTLSIVLCTTSIFFNH